MIKGYFLMPHPPIAVHEVGNGREEEIKSTIEAFREVEKKIDEINPETIIIVSPHGPVFKDAIGIFSSNELSGDLGDFNAPQIKFNYKVNKNLVDRIIKKSEENDINVVRLDKDSVWNYQINIKLDHGAMVPLYFVARNKLYKLVHITYGMLSPIELLRFGNCIREVTEECEENIVFIASGDLSHRLIKNGPYPYSHFGKEFDESLINTLKIGDLKGIFNLDKKMINEAGQCGLRSLYIMAGAINTSNIKSKLYSYEGTFGVGYSIMEFSPNTGDLLNDLLKEREEENKRRCLEGNIYTKLARKNLNYYFNEGKLLEVNDISNSELLNDKKGVFVSLKINGELRGCIGTIEPATDSIAEEIIRNSISAALNDPRFSPVRKEELKEIDISVDLLYPPEECNFEDLDPKIYGVIVSSVGKRGLLLPNLEGIDTIEKQVSIAMEKAGILPNEKYSLERFKVERFKEVEDDD